LLAQLSVAPGHPRLDAVGEPESKSDRFATDMRLTVLPPSVQHAVRIGLPDYQAPNSGRFSRMELHMWVANFEPVETSAPAVDDETLRFMRGLFCGYALSLPIWGVIILVWLAL
jgi:hypothetical protein